MPDPSPLTPSELSALVELEKKATPEPWHSAPRTADCARIWSEHRASDGVHPPLDELSAMLMWPAHPNEPAAEAAAVDVTFANAELIAALRNAAPRLFAEVLALREENERLRASAPKMLGAASLGTPVRTSPLVPKGELWANDEWLKKHMSSESIPPRPPPPPEPRPKRAVAGTSLICTACGCRWKKHAPCDVFPNGSFQLYDADQRPCAQCDNASTVPLRPETPNDQKDDSA